MIDHLPKSDRAADVEPLLFAVRNAFQFGNPFDVENVRCGSVATFEHGEKVCSSCKEKAILFQLLLDGQKLLQPRGFVIRKSRKPHRIHSFGCLQKHRAEGIELRVKGKDIEAPNP
jgi:hypothetical protein